MNREINILRQRASDSTNNHTTNEINTQIKGHLHCQKFEVKTHSGHLIVTHDHQERHLISKVWTTLNRYVKKTIAGEIFQV